MNRLQLLAASLALMVTTTTPHAQPARIASIVRTAAWRASQGNAGGGEGITRMVVREGC